jgi:phospholipid/cholesterol/gamma-HCH transport system ATP-binding protein
MADPVIGVRGVTMAYGDYVVMRDLDFDIAKGEIFVIMGGSGCGKSTLLRHLIGLNEPAAGRIMHGSVDFTAADKRTRDEVMRGVGVLFQSGALYSSLTLAENVGLLLEEYVPELSPAEVREVASLKLSLVGLKGFEDFYPSEISGGMRKRAGLARALALDPGVLCIDEPSAGLDPISSKLLDELIVELRDSLGTTVVIVTHELASIFAIGTNSVFLDVERRTMTALGDPRMLRDHADDPSVRTFLNRGVVPGAEP